MAYAFTQDVPINTEIYKRIIDGLGSESARRSRRPPGRRAARRRTSLHRRVGVGGRIGTGSPSSACILSCTQCSAS